MLDGSGRIRITDFGLAGVTGETLRAGTPAYMAPEQLAGGEVTPRSDIYALGLVLYELFTGQRAIEAKNVAELVRKREAGVAPPSTLVRDLDPAIDRAILRCLERDPVDRPSSALGVAAALPGGDPLAAALAAGETPSPEMVAAAGTSSALAPRAALAGLVTTLVCLAAYAALSDRVLITSFVPLEKAPDVLIDRAHDAAATLGYADTPVDTASGFATASEYLRFALQRREGAAMLDRIRSGRPPALLFWYRSSPRQMVPTGNDERVTAADPPLTITNMRSVVLDTAGRLVEFAAVPAQLEDQAAAAAPANWQPVLQLAGLDPARLQRVTPLWTPRTYADERAAWEGPMPGWPEQKVRVEAAAYRSRIVFFQTINPWTQPTRMREAPRTRGERIIQPFVAAVVLLVLGVAALVARHNLRKGRGDRRGALRVWIAIFVATSLAWVMIAAHFPDVNVELGRLFNGIGFALFCAGAVWLLYLALEPYVRKFWPATLISWSRFVAGNVKDPLVGRDILIGVLVTSAVLLIARLDILARPLLGYPALPPAAANTALLSGTRNTLGLLGTMVFSAAFNAVWIVFGLVAVNLVVRRVWITAVVMIGFLMLTGFGSSGEAPPAWLNILTGVTTVTLVVVMMLRFGLLATFVSFLANFLLNSAPLTFDSSRWFFSTSLTLLLIVAAMAVYGFYASRGGEPLLGRRLLD